MKWNDVRGTFQKVVNSLPISLDLAKWHGINPEQTWVVDIEFSSSGWYDPGVNAVFAEDSYPPEFEDKRIPISGT